jgi:hypothetical protein
MEVVSWKTEALELLELDDKLTPAQERRINQLTEAQYKKLVHHWFYGGLDYCLNADACLTLPTGGLHCIFTRQRKRRFFRSSGMA